MEKVWRSGDGSIVEAGEFLGSLEIIGLDERIDARITALGEEFIIGRRVIDRYRLILDHGEKVIVEK